MVARILAALLIGTLVMMLILWIITGGPQKTIQSAKDQPNILSSFFGSGTLGTVFGRKLPWSDSVALPQGANIDAYMVTEEDIANQYRRPTTEDVDFARNFGMPSPYRSQVVLQQGHADESGVQKEYIVIRTERDNDSPIDMTGWSVLSLVTGVKMYLPPAATSFIGGAINSTERLTVPPGSTLYVVSGASPVGVSFRENMCSGYLGKLQSFYPSLNFSVCPDPTEALPQTADNLRTYGSSCFDYIRELSRCEFPQEIPNTLSFACRSFAQDTYSYNGCVRMYGADARFVHNSWRLYLNSQLQLWDNSHDIIRLLDAEGRTVDAITY